MMMRKSFSSARRTASASGPPFAAGFHVEIESRGERASGASEDHDADVLIGFGGVERPVKPVDHGGVDRVELLRPIQREHRQRIASFVADEPVVHDQPLRAADAATAATAGTTRTSSACSS
jgi:hypothetical protein